MPGIFCFCQPFSGKSLEKVFLGRCFVRVCQKFTGYGIAVFVRRWEMLLVNQYLTGNYGLTALCTGILKMPGNFFFCQTFTGKCPGSLVLSEFVRSFTG